MDSAGGGVSEDSAGGASEEGASEGITSEEGDSEGTGSSDEVGSETGASLTVSEGTVSELLCEGSEEGAEDDSGRLEEAVFCGRLLVEGLEVGLLEAVDSAEETSSSDSTGSEEETGSGFDGAKVLATSLSLATLNLSHQAWG